MGGGGGGTPRSSIQYSLFFIPGDDNRGLSRSVQGNKDLMGRQSLDSGTPLCHQSSYLSLGISSRYSNLN